MAHSGSGSPMTARAELPAGTDVARYTVTSVLGRGAMSVVYEARDAELGRFVALKVLAPAVGEGVRFRDRFLRESRLAASLDHPNVIPIYDAGEADGLLYIAMRLVVGTDLRGLLSREAPLAPERALWIVGQAASDIFDGAADRVAAIERALRTAQDLDPLDVVDVEHRALRPIQVDIVEINADALFEAGNRVLLADTANECGQCTVGAARRFERGVGRRVADVGDVDRVAEDVGRPVGRPRQHVPVHPHPRLSILRDDAHHAGVLTVLLNPVQIVVEQMPLVGREKLTQVAAGA